MIYLTRITMQIRDPEDTTQPGGLRSLSTPEMELEAASVDDLRAEIVEYMEIWADSVRQKRARELDAKRKAEAAAAGDQPEPNDAPVP
jgi:hypothetical protein